LPDLGLQGKKVGGFVSASVASKNVGGVLKQLLLPFVDLVGVQFSWLGFPDDP
jgi:hypothetical protein